jgi:ubiquinone/menaquinone biosynthesis C-methylase UbiE
MHPARAMLAELSGFHWSGSCSPDTVAVYGTAIIAGNQVLQALCLRAEGQVGAVSSLMLLAQDAYMFRNQQIYNLPDVAAGYAQQCHLQPPEETILRLLLPHLPTARMLDLGVGGGRTTVHFANQVREYVGADYSESMVMECRKRFAGSPAHISFRVCDATSMDMFVAGSFDFILFSHNGMDYVNHEGRLRILKEIRRVGKPGGYFCFSTHNLNWCANLFELRRVISPDPRLALRTAKRLLLRFFYNWRVRAASIRSSPHLMINDGAHSRKLRTYFVRPQEQLAQLKEDFTDVRVFSLATGAEISNQSELQSVEDPWLYYLCRIKGLTRQPPH